MARDLRDTDYVEGCTRWNDNCISIRTMTPISKWPLSEQPRERLLGQGAAVLTEAELLALVLGTSGRGSGGVLQVCRDLLSGVGGLDGLSRCTAGELMQRQGIGKAKACAILGALELARRLEGHAPRRGDSITSAQDAYRCLKSRLGRPRQEIFWVLALDAKHRLITARQVAVGSVTSVEVHPREVFSPLLREAAAAVIVAHNHPSGDPEPSEQDRALTERLKQAGEILGIPLLDHLVVGDGAYVSLAERGLL
jgi:DNA repair protein RadC